MEINEYKTLLKKYKNLYYCDAVYNKLLSKHFYWEIENNYKQIPEYIKFIEKEVHFADKISKIKDIKEILRYIYYKEEFSQQFIALYISSLLYIKELDSNYYINNYKINYNKDELTLRKYNIIKLFYYNNNKVYYIATYNNEKYLIDNYLTYGIVQEDNSIWNKNIQIGLLKDNNLKLFTYISLIKRKIINKLKKNENINELIINILPPLDIYRLKITQENNSLIVYAIDNYNL